ncbi:MAG TPA: ABC transporter permease subunit [Thermoleophilaceae bacterium]|nr:ABC transporter permease subunit [Thermoleophilaceae bacterium]
MEGSYVQSARALVGRTFHHSRKRTLVFAWLFAAYAYIQPVGYRHSYPTLRERIGFAHGFANNKSLRLFYGQPHDLLTSSGYSAWRVGGVLAIAAAFLGLLAAVRALRGDEDAGRTEAVLAGPVGRRAFYLSSISAVGVAILSLWLAEFLGLTLGGLPASGAAYLALATVSVGASFASLGAVASQFAPTPRGAISIGSATLALMLLLRALADTVSGLEVLRWITPLGWAEQLRPFAGPQPLVLLLPILASLSLLTLGARIFERRDLGTGLLPARDSADARFYLLGSPAAQALRIGRAPLASWTGCLALSAFILGTLSKAVSSADISPSVQRQLAKLGSASITTPAGYLAVVFIVFVLAISLFGCMQLSAIRQEEAGRRLETLLALPLGRRRWIGTRLLMTAVEIAVLALVVGLSAWLGSAVVGAGVSLPKMLEAGANAVPVGVLFIGVGAVGFGLLPRATAGVAYGAVTVSFVWQLVGSLSGAPSWLVSLTPFAHVGWVSTGPFRLGAAAVMIATGAATALAAIALFGGRDVVSD